MQSKADIHIHTSYSDGFHTPEAIIHLAAGHAKLRLIAITDHNTIDGANQAVHYWQQNRQDFPKLEVIRGIEVSSSRGHIIGLFVHEDIPAGMSPADTVKAIHEQNGLAIAAHPFTHLMPFGDLQGIGKEIAELPLDGVETRNSVPTELYANWITALFNRRHRNHVAVGGSDTHFRTMLGKTFTWYAGHTAEDFRESLQRRQVRPGGYISGPLLLPQVLLHAVRHRHWPLSRSSKFCVP